jgi:general secretion pathway protein A
VYENFYHLRAKPFRLSPDPTFFFASRGHKRALAYLRYGLNQAEGFVVITGAPGTGKTTLAQILLQEMDQSDVVVAHLTTTQLEADEMLRMVLASFGLRYEAQDKAGMLKTLEAFFMARARERKRVLLVVDEAQNLPPRSLEELRMLSNLQVGDKALLQTFLLGQVQFRQMLDHPDLEQLRQRVIANYHLSALAADECQSYVESRLNHVGWQDDPHFTERAYQTIFDYTEGVPRRINMLCDRVMLFSSLEERHTVDEQVLKAVTDELQNEISGRPLPPVNLSEELPDVAATDTLSEDKATVGSETFPAEDSVVPEERDMATESETREHVGGEDTAGSDPGRTLEGKQAENVTEDVKPSFAQETSEPGAQPQFTGTDDSDLERAVPDDGWNQLVAQAQPDDVDVDTAAMAADKPAEKDRFRVITGGKDTAADSGPGIERPANHPSPTVMAPLPDAPGDTQEVVLRKILRLVLAFHRSPRSFPGLDDPTQPLPKGVQQILELATADDQVLSGLRQIAVMGISPAMLRAAVRFFVRRVFFLPGGDDFRVLGLMPDATLVDVETHYGLLMKLLRQDNKVGEDSGVARVGASYERLCRSDLATTLAAGGDELGNLDDVEEKLDLDLAPQLTMGTDAGLRTLGGAGGDIITSEQRTGPTLRNIMLISGAAVIVLLLYLTQIRGPQGTTPIAEVPATEAPVAATRQEEATAAVAPESPVVTEGAAQTGLAVAKEAADDPAIGEGLSGDANDADSPSQTGQAIAAMQLKAKQEAEAKAAAEAQAKVEAEAKAAAIAKRKAEAEAKALAEAKAAAKAKAEARALAEAQAKAAAKAKAEAKAKAKAEAKARAEAKAKAEAKALAKAKAEAERAAAEQAAARKAAEEKKAAQLKLAAVSVATAPTTATPEAAAPKDNPTDNKVPLAALQSLVAEFEAAYQTGDLDALMSLFAPTARTSDQVDRAGVRADYARLFGSSSERDMRLKDISWEREANYAGGIGTYEATVKDKAGAVSKQAGEVTLQLEDTGGKLRITRFYTTVSETAVSSAKETAAQNRSTPVSAAALNAVLAAFGKAYDAGNIEQFMGLFSADAQTNDRPTPAGIREDYVGLFNNTTYRHIAFRDMNWTWDDNIARGEGKYEVVVQGNGSTKRDTYKGPLWIQVERRDGQPRIIYFAFVE